MPAGIFGHVYGSSFETGKFIVEHPHIKAVGFTGSLTGGRQLFDWANQRKEPIPVFAEMSSVNPIFLLPERLASGKEELAKLIANSVTLGVGQFCTNPGLVIGIDNDDLRSFMQSLGEEIKQANPGDMLNPGIFKNYVERRANALALEEVETVAIAEAEPVMNQGVPTIAAVPAKTFILNPLLHQEVFGPYSLVITCHDMQEMLDVARAMEGQLTATLMATKNDIENNQEFTDVVKYIGGRFILNSVPTGVEVCLAMQHGGPYPASTDSRFGSVGADAIKRFARPLSFQNWGNDLLPDELKNENPLGIWRTVDGEVKR
jgi:NADP-dependent aldehyde dehydrogenase